MLAQGEEGDTFYIVEAGACNVLGADGHSVGQRLGCGGFAKPTLLYDFFSFMLSSTCHIGCICNRV